MYDFYFQYFDQSDYFCKDIDKVVILTTSGFKEFSGDEILKHPFKIHDELYLFSNSSSYTVSCKNLKTIRISKK